MKVIHKTKKQELQAKDLVVVNDKVVVQTPSVPDGRNGFIKGNKVSLTVVKVNKQTFDGQDNEGNIFRVDIRDDQFQVAIA